ncbi:MAG TPA: hypothetical protein V6D20_06185, partial [Candidatus Obscuribacterales bacterium]
MCRGNALTACSGLEAGGEGGCGGGGGDLLLRDQTTTAATPTATPNAASHGLFFSSDLGLLGTNGA